MDIFYFGQDGSRCEGLAKIFAQQHSTKKLWTNKGPIQKIELKFQEPLSFRGRRNISFGIG